MKSTGIKIAAALMAAGINVVHATTNVFERSPNPEPRRRLQTSGSRLRYRIRVRGKDYPEQSSRQALRGYRRAQGGPGIELIGGTYHIAIPGCNF